MFLRLMKMLYEYFFLKKSFYFLNIGSITQKIFIPGNIIYVVPYTLKKLFIANEKATVTIRSILLFSEY